MAHVHRFKIAYNLPLGVADAAGWIPKLLIRACRTCDYAEALHGTENQALARNRLHAWKAWAEGRLLSRGEMRRWKHT